MRRGLDGSVTVGNACLVGGIWGYWPGGGVILRSIGYCTGCGNPDVERCCSRWSGRDVVRGRE